MHFPLPFWNLFSLWRSMPTTSGAFGFSIVLMAKIDDEELEEIGWHCMLCMMQRRRTVIIHTNPSVGCLEQQFLYCQWRYMRRCWGLLMGVHHIWGLPEFGQETSWVHNQWGSLWWHMYLAAVQRHVVGPDWLALVGHISPCLTYVAERSVASGF